jgi:hypothetical protein
MNRGCGTEQSWLEWDFLREGEANLPLKSDFSTSTCEADARDKALRLESRSISAVTSYIDANELRLSGRLDDASKAGAPPAS